MQLTGQTEQQRIATATVAYVGADQWRALPVDNTQHCRFLFDKSTPEGRTRDRFVRKDVRAWLVAQSARHASP